MNDSTLNHIVSRRIEINPVTIGEHRVTRAEVMVAARNHNEGRVGPGSRLGTIQAMLRAGM
jgi:hypothetical protein